MISYPKIFSETQTETPHINYYYLVTGPSRIKIDAIKGNVDNAGLPYGDIICPTGAASFKYSCDGDTLPYGEVPLPSGTIDFILVTDYYANYDWKTARINVYAQHDSFPEDILICCYRVTDAVKNDNRISLTLDNKFQTKMEVDNLIDDKREEETFSPASSLSSVYNTINKEVKHNFVNDSPIINGSFLISKLESQTRREILSDIGETCGGGMLLHTAYDSTSSGFRFAPIDLRKYKTTSVGTDKSKKISGTGALVDDDRFTVTEFIPVDFSKSFIYNINYSYLTETIFDEMRVASYDADKNYISNIKLSDFSTALGKGYFHANDLFPEGATEGYIRFTTSRLGYPELMLVQVDHILKNWINLHVDLPVTPTAIKYTFAGNSEPLYSNSAVLTSIDTTGEAYYIQDHLTVIETQTAFNNRTYKYLDYYAVVNRNTGAVSSVGYDASTLTWNNNYYIVLAHGTYAIWSRNTITESDNVVYNPSTLVLTVNPSYGGQNYVIDMTENKILTNSSASNVIGAVGAISDLVIGQYFYPFSGEYIDFPFAEPFDTVGLIDRHGDVYFSFLMEASNKNYGKTTFSNSVKFGTID